MSMALVSFGWIVCVTTPISVVLSICIGVGGCGCPISSSRCRSRAASRVLMYSSSRSTSAADVMTDLNIFDTLSMALLFSG